METAANYAFLRGTLVELPQFSHENHGSKFFRTCLDIPRLSGNSDILPLVLREDVLNRIDPSGGERIAVRGQVRSYRNSAPEGPKLMIFLYGEDAWADDEEPCNEVNLIGRLCKDPVYRRTPLGREICDGMLSVPRQYRRSDYLPCIFWGRTAMEISQGKAGDWISLSGRLQSRPYRKVTPEGTFQRTAYEISALNASLEQEPQEHT